MLTSKRIAEGVPRLRAACAVRPRCALVLEEQMQGFPGELAGLEVVLQREVPGFPQPRRGESGGRFLFGRLDGLPVAVALGGPRLFEGYQPGECGMTVGLLAGLGARTVVLVASGEGLRAGLDDGTMLLLADRIDATGVAHLKGVTDLPGGPLVAPPPTPPEAAGCARAAGAAAGVAVAEGVVALVHGPLLPTAAERRALALLGADAVTAGLAPELAAAVRAGVRHAAFVLAGGRWEPRHLEFCRALLAALAATGDAGLDAGATPA